MARRANTSPKRTPHPARKVTSAENGVPAHIMGPRLVLLLSVLILVLLGFVMVYSASSIEALNEGAPASSYLIKQLGFAVIGCAGAVIAWKFIPYHVWMGKLLWVVWAGSIVLLILTALIGSVGLGAQRWLVLGPISIQPSEFAKIAFVLMMARILFDFRNGELTVGQMFAQSFLFIVVPLLILYQTQSDLGTTLICFVGVLTVMWLGEVPLRTILLILLGVGLFAVLASLVGYRQDRMVFLNPWSDEYGTGYQLIRSLYAFSEGGIFGVGLGNSREKFLWLPEAETDFIFAIIGEELGLIGAVIVVVLFLVLLYAGSRIARSAPDNFGSMIAGGLTVMIVFQAFLNIGCVIGVLPTTGKPLPFISSGGSSLIACLWMVGLILSVSQHSDVPSIYDQRRQNLRVVRSEPLANRSKSRSGSGSKGRGASASPSSNRNRTRR